MGSEGVLRVNVSRHLFHVALPVLLLAVRVGCSMETEIPATSFRSNGDLISGWHWLRDPGLAHQAWWTFEGIPAGTEDVVLNITCLATSRASGPRGVSAQFRLGYGTPGSGMMGGAFYVQEVELPNAPPPEDPVGYTCRGTVVIPRDTPGLVSGTLTVFAERISPSGPHVAFSLGSIVVRVVEAADTDSSATVERGACSRAVEGLAALTAGLAFPKHFAWEDATKYGSEFDVNQYFVVLDTLAMEEGYVLDYVYLFEGIGGYPVLYTRPEGQPPFATYADLAAAHGEPRGEYLRYLRIADTPEGYLQFVVLAIMGEQFYLYWHAFYNDVWPVCTVEGLEDVLDSLDGSLGWAMSPEDKARARAIDIVPQVSLGAETVVVRLVTFTRWGGFIEGVYTIARHFPHEILDVRRSTLVEYNCGVMF